MSHLLATTSFLIASLIQASTLQAQWADLKVKVVYDGPAPTLANLNGDKDPFCATSKIPDERMIVGKNGELVNFAIIMDMRKSDSTDIHPALAKPPAQPLVIDNKNCVFAPRVAFARTGRPIEVTNSDPCGHNYKIDPFSNPAQSVMVPRGQPLNVTFNKPERSNFTEFSCTIHPWMKGQLIIRDHPYVGISGKDGIVSIEKLPAGKVTFKLVHENMKKSISEGKIDGKPAKWRSGYIELDLQAGLNEHTITLDPDLFED